MNVSLLSTPFLLLSVAAIVLLAVLRGRRRQLAFLALNLGFVWGLLLGPVRGLGTLGFIMLGYLLTQVGARHGRRALASGLTGYVALFIYLRGYDFLGLLLPDAMLTTALRAVGLSFVLFKVVHVMIDAASGTLGRLDLLTYLNYCLNFTTFMMGPIQRYQDYREQWDGTREAIPARFESYLDAVIRVLVGAAKAYLVAPVFFAGALQPDTDLLALSVTGLATRAYAFWFYLYCNFSGYCDMVIGIGSVMGVRPPENFDRSFLARNISDFWQRQHRSLTLWLTDYVFNPLYASLLARPWGGRHKLLAANLSLMVTMLVSGLWHGTTISFLLFGLVHGLWFVVYRTWDALLTARLGRDGVRRFRANPLVHAAGIVCTFNATAFAFIFFQSSPERIMQVLAALLPS